ncbi:N-acetyltransferase ECO1 [Leucoagaricus sp. SymC.cos]|nr:N-acetyltransferase ECO1 [Leucoagaricus sp. SymC.cos]
MSTATTGTMQVKRTYGSRQNSSPALSLKNTTNSSPIRAGQKRPLAEVFAPSLYNIPTPSKRTKHFPTPLKAVTKSKPKPKSSTKSKQKTTLIQLHFATDQTTLRTCPLCDLSYTKGAPEDESLHRSHCARVQRGMEWGREEERESAKVGVIEITSQVKPSKGKRGRIISCPAECTGRIGNKITALLQTINLSLSSPPLTQKCLRDSKVYLFLVPHTPSMTSSSITTSGREKIVGCVVAQRIATAMTIASAAVVKAAASSTDVAVDSGTGLFCHPKPLPTPMGIPRLFVPSTYRRQGIASALLNAAAATFIHGCPLDPKKGQVAFTQPTGDGKAVMMKWGGGGARIYEE